MPEVERRRALRYSSLGFVVEQKYSDEDRRFRLEHTCELGDVILDLIREHVREDRRKDRGVKLVPGIRKIIRTGRDDSRAIVAGSTDVREREAEVRQKRLKVLLAPVHERRGD